MAYTASKLNNIAGSIGRANIWIYTDTDTAVTDIDADDYFAGANDYGMTVGDIIFLVGTSGADMMGYVEVISATASQLSAISDVAH